MGLIIISMLQYGFIGNDPGPESHCPSVKEIINQVRDIQQDIKFLKQQNEIALQTSKLLEFRIEEQRTKTLQELNALLKVKE